MVNILWRKKRKNHLVIKEDEVVVGLMVSEKFIIRISSDDFCLFFLFLGNRRAKETFKSLDIFFNDGAVCGNA